MTGIEIQPATADRWADVERVVGHGSGRFCWCQWFWLPTREFEALKTAGRRERLHEMTAADRPPGLIAYVDGEPAGWCGFGPRAEMPRVERSRLIPKVDERAVWSIVCFQVRPQFRRHGVTEALVRGAIRYAGERGIECLEAYPADAAGVQVRPESGYVGALSTFERLGFVRVADTKSKSAGVPRVVVRLELGEA